MSATKETLKPKAAGERLAELEQEAEQLKRRRRELLQQLAHGRTAEQTDRLASRLIAGESVAELSGDLDIEAELRPIDGQLATLDAAMNLLRAEQSLMQLRAGHQQAAPLHRKAIAHAPRIAAALAELEQVLTDATVDVRAFQRVDDELAYAQGQHPTERAPYDAAYVGGGAAQAAHLLHDWWPMFFREPDGSELSRTAKGPAAAGVPGYMKSRLDRWREEALELGLRLA